MSKYNFKKEHIEKLYKGGLISEKTAKAHGYAEGGIIDSLFGSSAPQASVNPDYVSPTVAASQAAPEVQAAAVPAGDGAYQGPAWLQSTRQALGINPGENMISVAGDKIKGVLNEGAKKYLPDIPPGAPGFMPKQDTGGTTGAMQPASIGEQGNVSLAGNGPGGQQKEPEMPVYDPQVQAGFQQGAARAAGDIGYNKTIQNEANQIQKNLEEDNAKAQSVFDQAQSYAQQALAANPDPKQIREKFWDDKTTGQKLLAGVGLILGAMSPDGVNRAVGIIERQIDQNIKAQEQKSERLGKMADQSSTLYNQLRQKGMDKFQASLAVKDLMFKDAKLQIEKQEANAKSASQKGNALEAKLKLDEMIMKNQKALTEHYATERVNNPSVSKEQKVKYVNSLPPDQRALYVDGAGAFARSSADASKIREQDQAFNSSLSLINRLETIGGKALPYSQKQAEAKTVTELLRAALRVPVLGPGTVNEAERARLEDIARDPSQLFQTNSGAKMQELKRSLQTMQRAQYQAYGLPTSADPEDLAAGLGARKR